MRHRGRFRLRTRLRRHLPWTLVNGGVAGKGRTDCGAHEWYNHDGITARCYHCEVGEAPFAVAHQPAQRAVDRDGDDSTPRI